MYIVGIRDITAWGIRWVMVKSKKARRARGGATDQRCRGAVRRGRSRAERETDGTLTSVEGAVIFGRAMIVVAPVPGVVRF